MPAPAEVFSCEYTQNYRLTGSPHENIYFEIPHARLIRKPMEQPGIVVLPAIKFAVSKAKFDDQL